MRKTFFITVLALLSVLSLQSQDPVAEPEFEDVFFGLNAGKLITLERQSAVIKGKAGGFLVVSMKSSSEFPGAKSPVRFQSGQPLEFVVRSPLLSLSAQDPNTFYVLRKLNPKKKSRELIIMSGHASPIGASTKSALAEGVLT